MAFLEPEGPLPCSQKSVTASYPEPSAHESTHPVSLRLILLLLRQIVSSKTERADRKTYVLHERNEVGRQVERLSAGASFSEN
jgi:hypothetical protein